MKLTPVESSMIQAVGYDADAEEMEILFTSGMSYRYKDVPKSVYEELLASDSKGSYMHACVLDVYAEYRLSSRRRR